VSGSPAKVAPDQRDVGGGAVLLRSRERPPSVPAVSRRRDDQRRRGREELRVGLLHVGIVEGLREPARLFQVSTLSIVVPTSSVSRKTVWPTSTAAVACARNWLKTPSCVAWACAGGSRRNGDGPRWYLTGQRLKDHLSAMRAARFEAALELRCVAFEERAN